MGAAVSLAEAKAFLRLDGDAEDAVVEGLVASASERLERELGVVLSASSPAPLKQAALHLVAHGFENREGAPPEEAGSPGFVEALVRPYRTVRL